MQNFAFAGHQTFVFRQIWPYKAYRLATHLAELPTIDDQIAFLGIGTFMIKALKFWAKICEIYDPKNNLTPFAEKLFSPVCGLDPFCENLNTIYLLHYKAAKKSNKLTALYFLFNVFNQTSFTADLLFKEFENYLAELNNQQLLAKIPVKNTCLRDLDVVLRSYAFTYQNSKFKNKTPNLDLSDNGIDSLFKDLNLLENIEGNFNLYRTIRPNLKLEIFTYCLIEYLEDLSNTPTLSFDDICYAKGSPGLIFKLNENAVSDYLLELSKLSQNKLVFIDQTGIKQILINVNSLEELSALKQELLEHAYQN